MPRPIKKQDLLNNPIVVRKAAMANAGITSRYIAQKLGIAHPSVSRAINGKIKIYMIRAAITYHTGLPHADLWGELAKAPTPDQAYKLEKALGVRFCSRDQHRPYKLLTQCFNCGHHAGCKPEVSEP